MVAELEKKSGRDPKVPRIPIRWEIWSFQASKNYQEFPPVWTAGSFFFKWWLKKTHLLFQGADFKVFHVKLWEGSVGGFEDLLFSPRLNLENDPNWRAYFQDGLVQPPTRKMMKNGWCLFIGVPLTELTKKSANFLELFLYPAAAFFFCLEAPVKKVGVDVLQTDQKVLCKKKWVKVTLHNSVVVPWNDQHNVFLLPQLLRLSLSLSHQYRQKTPTIYQSTSWTCAVCKQRMGFQFRIMWSNYINLTRPKNPKCSKLEGKWDPLFRGNLGWWNTVDGRNPAPPEM